MEHMGLKSWLKTWGIPLLGYCLVAGVVVAPAFEGDAPRILGGGELGGWLWRHWWMKMELVALTQKFSDAPLTWLLQIFSLGRYPETGNVTDLLLLSVPLDLLFGHPHHYNVKVFLILVANGMAGYAYSRHLTGRAGVAWLAGVTLAANTLVIYECLSSGLRQAILCFLPLFLLYLDRTLEERRLRPAIGLGVFFALTAAFYWFYGLFAALIGLARIVTFWVRNRHIPVIDWLKPLGVAGVVAAILIMPVIAPYLLIGSGDAPLPEVSWFKQFPSPEQLANAPLRPDTRGENLLASLARVLYSSWPLDWVVNPLQIRVVPLVMTFLSVGVGIWRWRKTGFWLALFAVFYSLTWGPYLKVGDEFVRVADTWVVRLPYWYAFQFVPMMSRLFAPYRMASIVMVAMMVLLALNLAPLSLRLERRPRVAWALGALFLGLYFGQLYLDPLQLQKVGSNKMLPLPASEVTVPDWYSVLAKEKGRVGIVELPLERQQDLLNYYQVVHSKKVLGGWADPGALPPALRNDAKPQKVGALLRWLSQPDRMERNVFAQNLKRLGQRPYTLEPSPEDALATFRAYGYRYVVLHELGCYLLEPRWGKELYARMKSQLEKTLGPLKLEALEHTQTDDMEAIQQLREGAPWAVSLYLPLLIPEPRPVALHMAVFEVPGSSEVEKAGTEAAGPGQAP